MRAVIHRGSPLLIIAGPGSGKTEVLARRVAHLIRSGDASPENLLVTTFTNKAALELKDRIQQKLPEVNVELMQVSTIHSFCAQLLHQHRRGPGSTKYRILDAERPVSIRICQPQGPGPG
ncbi:MAG: UvrD-helicase domain-containing protein [Methanotrichaceae archaeon]|nr:UvrD-helicase domain-containing protein [Methanotrichaceae archaeon]